MLNRRSIGLTGGIACGKSAAAGLLTHHGLPVLDADAIARRLMQPHGTLYAPVVALFGAGIVEPQSGQIDRRQLGRIVFGSPEKRRRLEELVHPAVYGEIEAALEAPDRTATLAVEIPLLFETGSADRFDEVWTVACSAQTQWRRMRDRGWDEAECRARLDAQWPLERKMEEADVVLWNEFGMDWLAPQIELALARMEVATQAAGTEC